MKTDAARAVDPNSLNPNPGDPTFQVNLFFIAIYLCLRYRRSFQPSKENIQHFKKWKLFSMFVDHFCPPGPRYGSRDQGFESGSGSRLDPYSIGPVPDPYSESGSGSRRAKITHKSRKNSCFEVLDGLFCELQASSVTWTYFIEAKG